MKNKFIKDCPFFCGILVLGDDMKCNIEELIRDKGLRKDFIAKKLGVSYRQLRNYETMDSFPPIDKAYILADLLGVKVDDLYSRVED
jgi:transcriptional regulator with XRE-family HTH domain